MKRLIAATLVAAIGVSLLTGCGVSNKSHDNTQVGTTENSSDEAKNKEVKMHVWCSKDDVDITTQMIESFKEANKGTDFNIIIEESEDSDDRDNILSNVHNGEKYIWIRQELERIKHNLAYDNNIVMV